MTSETPSPRPESTTAPLSGYAAGWGPSAAVSTLRCLLPGCVGSRRVVGRQPRDRDVVADAHRMG